MKPVVALFVGACLLFDVKLSQSCGTSGVSTSSSSSASSSANSGTVSNSQSNNGQCGASTGPQGDGNKIAPWIVQVNNGSGTCPGVIVSANWIITQASCIKDISNILVLAGVNGSSGGGPSGNGNNNNGSMGGPPGQPGQQNNSSMPGQQSQNSTSHNWGEASGADSHQRKLNSQGQGGNACPPARVVFGNSQAPVVHPNYNAASGAYNIALVKLNGSFSFDQKDIQSLCLPQSSTDCNNLCVTNNSSSANTNTTGGNNRKPEGGKGKGKQGFQHGFKGCGFGGKNQWTQVATDFEATAQSCLGSASNSSSSDGSSAVTVSGGSNGAQTACMLPNGGNQYTVICCILDWVNSYIHT